MQERSLKSEDPTCRCSTLVHEVVELVEQKGADLKSIRTVVAAPADLFSVERKGSTPCPVWRRTFCFGSECDSDVVRSPIRRSPYRSRFGLDLDPTPASTSSGTQPEGLDVGLDGHTHFGTTGLALGEAACDIPTRGCTWIATRQPVVLKERPGAGHSPPPFHHRRELG